MATNVPVSYLGEKKLVPILSESITYDDLEQKLKDRFKIADDKLEISVEIPNGEKYRIQDDVDLEPLRNQLKMFHIKEG
jgi:hypothetical protein